MHTYNATLTETQRNIITRALALLQKSTQRAQNTKSITPDFELLYKKLDADINETIQAISKLTANKPK